VLEHPGVNKLVKIILNVAYSIAVPTWLKLVWKT